MKVRQEENGRIIVSLREIEPFFLDLLRRIPDSTDPGDDPAARARLHSVPVDPAEDEENFNDDWRAYVQPELRALFQSAVEIVSGDLADLPPPEDRSADDFDPADFVPGEVEMGIPRQHADAWLSVLNQARLVIAAKQGFTENDMEESLPLPPFDEREFALFQVHFYDYLQQALLQAMGFD